VHEAGKTSIIISRAGGAALFQSAIDFPGFPAFYAGLIYGTLSALIFIGNSTIYKDFCKI